MRTIKTFLFLVSVFTLNSIAAQTVVKMDMPKQADQPIKVVALFDEEIPEGIPVVLGLMGYDVEGGISPYLFEWMLNGEVVSTNDIVIFTPNIGDDLSLKVIDNNKCRASTSFNLKVARIPQNPTDGEIENIQVYPTMVTDFIHIKIPPTEGKKALVRIFNINGETVHQEYISESTRINTNLTSGTYFVSVRIGDAHKVEKIIAR
ncbi:MAG: T9SS type A sorting domain-containing protein [Prolixibacteraceae bacterium]|jgi:hypothetical protein|nr:T9SS type A sorting domain-containing protein [Prolixibacteraceae bacterium]